MIAPIRREPIDFMQEIPGTYDFRTGKIKYPQPGPVGGEIKPGIRDHLHRYGDPVDIFSGPYIPDDDSKVVPLSPLGGYLGALMANRTPRGDSTPIYFDDHMKQYMPRPFGPQEFPEYMQAGGPELFPIKKEPSGRMIKGIRRGVRTFEENDLRNQQGIIKASMDFLNQFNV